MVVRLLIACLFPLAALGQPFTFHDTAWLNALQSGGSAVAFQPETLTYSNNIALAGGSISNAQLVAIDNYVVAEKAIGSWTYNLECSPFAGNSTNAATVKLKYTVTTNLINEMQATEWSPTNGWANNTGSDFLNTQLTNMSPANNGFEVWFSRPIATMQNGEAAEYLTGHNAPTGSSRYAGIYTGGGDIMLNAFGNFFHSVGPGNPPKFVAGAGLFGFSRSSSNCSFAIQNQGIHDLDPTAYSTNGVVWNYPLFLFASYNAFNGFPAGAQQFTHNKPIGWYEFSQGRPTNLIAPHFTNVMNLMSALGRSSYHPARQRAVLIIGQSLATGGGNGSLSGSALLLNQYPSVLYCGGDFLPLAPVAAVATNQIAARNSLGGLVESGAETGWEAFGEHFHWLLTNNAYSDDSLYLMNWAQPGQCYSVLQKGSTNVFVLQNPMLNQYTNVYYYSMQDVATANATVQNLEGSAGLDVIGIVCCHGECDEYNSAYYGDLEQWGAQYAQDIMAVTGQTDSPKIYSMQMSTTFWPADGASFYPYSQVAQWQTANDNPLTNRVVGPRYQLIHQTDSVHLYNISYQRQGEYAAESLFNDVFLGQETDLRVTNVSRVAGVITLTYNHNGLVFDTNLVSWTTNYGFQFYNIPVATLPTVATNAPASNISTVTLAGLATNQVVIALSFVPTSNGTLTYAMNSTNGAPGPTAGARGNLRDSYSHTGFVTTSNLYNWSVAFPLTIP